MSTSKPPSKPSSKPPSKPVCSRELRYSEMQVKRIRSLRRDTKSVKIKPVQELFDLEFIYQILLIKLKPREEASEAEIAALNGVKANFLPYIAHAYPSIENHKSKFPPALFYPDFTCPWKVDNGREDCGTFSVILTDEKCNRSYACCSKFRMDEDDVRRKANVLGNCVLVFVSHYPTEYALMNIVVDSVRDLKRKRKTLEQICKENMNYHITNEEFCQGDTKIRVRDCAQLMVTPIAKSVERLGVETTVYIFMSLLAEKRILVSGENVKVVSDTVQMFSRLLAPLEWPHTLIPIIPDNLIDLCQNPTPYLCGTLRHNLHTLNQITRKSFAITAENEDITMVDTDLGIFSPKLEFSRISKKERLKILIKDGREMGFSKKMILDLVKFLQDVFPYRDVNKASVKIENRVMTWYANTFGHYRKWACAATFLTKKSKKKFARNHPVPETREFLHWFCESGIFQNFIYRSYEAIDPEHKKKKYPDQIHSKFEIIRKKHAPPMKAPGAKNSAHRLLYRLRHR